MENEGWKSRMENYGWNGKGALQPVSAAKPQPRKPHVREAVGHTLQCNVLRSN